MLRHTIVLVSGCGAEISDCLFPSVTEVLAELKQQAAVELVNRSAILCLYHAKGLSSGMFETLVHADWSMSPKKRWAARARRVAGNWQVEDPYPVGSCAALLDHCFGAIADGPVLVGFDFPIGVPAAFAANAGITSFRDALPLLGEGRWKDFFHVAETPGDISLERPFYPRSSAKGATRAALVAALGMSRYEELLRMCERRTSVRREACSLFWTLGGNQVGRAAISGWREIVAPALLRGARIWPFDGNLADLAKTAAVVIAETYPAEAYRMIDAGFAATESKRRVEDRRRKSTAHPGLGSATRREAISQCSCQHPRRIWIQVQRRRQV